MLNENLKSVRKAKGLTQEELAVRLNVVRQTVSKWEKGLSVPDADTLMRIAEIFEVSVSDLLGPQGKGGVEETVMTDVAEQLSRINTQLAIKNRRSRRIWKTVAIVVAAVVLFNLLLMVFSFSTYTNQTTSGSITGQTEEQIIP